MIRRASLLVLVALIVLAVVGDRLAEQAAAHAVGIKARQAALLNSVPTVSFHGFPFLTQAIGGRYRQIDVTTHDLHRGGLRLDTVTAQFHGVHVGLADALQGRVSEVPIDSGDGQVLITYADLNAYLAPHRLTVGDQQGGLRLSGPVSVPGLRAQVSGVLAIAVSGSTLVVGPDPGTLRGPSGLLAVPIATAAGPLLTIRIDTGVLPFGLTLRTAQARPDGVLVGARASGLVVPVPADASQR